MTVDIICPLYNADSYIYSLHNSLINQKGVSINKIRYVLTESKDKTKEILDSLEVGYKEIKKESFSHSLVREKEAFESDADIICFISQDVVIESDSWLKKLILPIINGEAEATYSKQISKYNNIEKYTREYNYPDISYIKSKNDIPAMELNTFFFSDASSAVRRDIFVKLDGYDHKDLPTSEDMYFAYKLIKNEYRIKYCADSIVYHSHSFTLKEVYHRYKLTGKFFKDNSYLDTYKTTKTGSDMAKYILKRIIQEHRIGLLLRYPFDMAARLFGMKAGKR